MQCMNRQGEPVYCKMVDENGTVPACMLAMMSLVFYLVNVILMKIRIPKIVTDTQAYHS